MKAIQLTNVSSLHGAQRVKVAAAAEKRLVTEAPGLGCDLRPSVAQQKFLDRVCEDCYSLYRDFDVFHMCRCVYIYIELATFIVSAKRLENFPVEQKTNK